MIWSFISYNPRLKRGVERRAEAFRERCEEGWVVPFLITRPTNVELAYDTEAPNPEEICVIRERLHLCMKNLSRIDRQIVMCTIFEGESVKSFADRHGASSHAILALRDMAVAKMRATLDHIEWSENDLDAAS